MRSPRRSASRFRRRDVPNACTCTGAGAPRPAALTAVARPSSRWNVAPQGDKVTYSITVQNKGPGTATGVVVGDTWSKPQTTFDAALSSSQCQGLGSQQAVCTLGTLTPGTIAFLRIVLDVNS